MFPTLLSLLIPACTPTAEIPPAQSTQPSGGLEVGSDNTVHVSALSPVELQLPESVLPEGSPPPGAVVLDVGWRRAGSGAWKHSSPVPFKAGKKYRSAPAGVSLVQGDRILEYGREWSLEDGQIHLQTEQDPSEQDTPVTFISLELRDSQARLDPASSGLEPQDYLHHQHTVKQGKKTETRSGMLLPAPARFTVELEVPEGARLDTAVALIDPEGGARSDGATLHILIDEQEVASAKATDADFDDLSVDLSAYAGKSVRLTFESAPGKSAEWDTLFIAEPLLTGTPKGPVRRVVVIGIDTLRYDVMSQHGNDKDVSVALQPIADSSLVFDMAYAPAPRTRPSFRSSTTGRYPVQAIDAQTFGETLRDAGFVTGGVTANVHLVPRFGFNDGYDSWVFENSVDADVQLDRATRFIEANPDRDSLLFLHLMDAHNFYRAPGRYKNMYVESDAGPLEAEMNRWKILGMGSKLTDENKLWLEERYWGEVRYLSDQLAAWLGWLLSLEGETLVVIHSDHGEEFWEHGSYEHNHTLYDEVTQANLWIRPPGGWGGGPHRVSEPVSLIDIAPTLYDMVGIPQQDWPELDGTSLRPYLDASQSAELPALQQALDSRPLQLGHLMYDQELWGVVFGGKKYILRTWDGRQELYDLTQDPDEQQDLASVSSTVELQAKMAEATGFPVGEGLRVHLDRVAEPLIFLFDQPVDAQVMDPEAASKRRANIEWGDMPAVWKHEIGSIDMAPNRESFTFNPGESPRGTLLLTLPQDGSAEVMVGEERVKLVPGVPVSVGRSKLRVERGVVILVQDRVEDHVETTTSRDADMEAELQALGYIEN